MPAPRNYKHSSSYICDSSQISNLQCLFLFAHAWNPVLSKYFQELSQISLAQHFGGPSQGPISSHGCLLWLGCIPHAHWEPLLVAMVISTLAVLLCHDCVLAGMLATLTHFLSSCMSSVQFLSSRHLTPTAFRRSHSPASFQAACLLMAHVYSLSGL